MLIQIGTPRYPPVMELGRHMALKMPGRGASRFESEMGDHLSDTRHYMYSFIRVKRTI